MNDRLATLLAALSAVVEPPARPSATAADPARTPGRPPALTPAQVTAIRRRRRLPLDLRPRVTELAAEFGVDARTVRRALRGVPPYDWGTPVPRLGSRNRTRGSGRFPD